MKKNMFNSFGFSLKNLKKAKNLILENLKNIDIIYELVDARAPKATKNSYIEKIVSKKARIIILARADLADEKKTRLWMDSFKKDNILAFSVDCKKAKYVKTVLQASKDLLSCIYKQRVRRNFIAKKFRAMVVGVPNIGKSTLINTLSYRKKTRCANFPGITLGKQWVFIDDNIDLLDTPGSLSFEDKTLQDRKILELIGCVKDGVYDVEELAIFFIDFLKNNYEEKFIEIFGENYSDDYFEFLEQYARINMFLKKGAIADTKRAADFLISSFRNKKLGRFSLELP